MGCNLYVSEKDLADMRASRSKGTPPSLDAFQSVMRELGRDGRDLADRVLEDPRMGRPELARTVFNVVQELNGAAAACVMRDLDTALTLDQSNLYGLLERQDSAPVLTRLASGPENHVKGALMELNVGAALIRGNRQLAGAGLHYSPADKLGFGQRATTNTSVLAGPNRGQQFFSFGQRRRTIEADIVVENRALTTTKRVGIDTKFRTHRSLNLGGWRPGNLAEKGRPRDPSGLEDQLLGVMVAVERGEFDKFALVTNTEFRPDVHRAVQMMNEQLAERGKPDDPIRLVEHYAP